ncbi:MAG: DM13 domain-containing protein [Alphaproteobacteria bacterium]
MASRRPVFWSFAVIAAVAIAAVAWWLGSPLFIDRHVDEPFPSATAPMAMDSMPSAEELAAMSDEEKAAMRDEVLDMAAAMPDTAMDDAMDMDMAEAEVARGTFRDGDDAHRGEGRAVIYRLADGSLHLRLEDFRVTNGPDLFVILSAADDPRDTAAIDAAPWSALAALKGNVGNQNYEIDPALDISQVRTVAIWCRAFGVLFAAAPLSFEAAGS